MTLEEKTSFSLKEGFTLITEVVIKEGEKKNYYKVHTHEDSKTSNYVTIAYKNNEFLGRYLPLRINPDMQSRYSNLIRALDFHFNMAVGRLKRGEVDEFIRFFAEPFTKSRGVFAAIQV